MSEASSRQGPAAVSPGGDEPAAVVQDPVPADDDIVQDPAPAADAPDQVPAVAAVAAPAVPDAQDDAVDPQDPAPPAVAPVVNPPVAAVAVVPAAAPAPVVAAAAPAAPAVAVAAPAPVVAAPTQAELRARILLILAGHRTFRVVHELRGAYINQENRIKRARRMIRHTLHPNFNVPRMRAMNGRRTRTVWVDNAGYRIAVTLRGNLERTTSNWEADNFYGDDRPLIEVYAEYLSTLFTHRHLITDHDMRANFRFFWTVTLEYLRVPEFRVGMPAWAH